MLTHYCKQGMFILSEDGIVKLVIKSSQVIAREYRMTSHTLVMNKGKRVATLGMENKG